MRHADAISAAFENEVMVQEAIREELAELRKKEATIQMLQSGLIIVTGAVAIIATAGAATPIVIGGFAAGSFTMAYGVSNFEEAKHSYRLGAAGDPYTSAFNPIRDTVFCGNQLAYDIYGQVSMTLSALVLPAGRALQAGTSIPRALAVHLGKTAIAGGTTYGVNKIGEHYGLSDDARFWIGVGAGALTGIVTQKIDEAYNLSGFHRTGFRGMMTKKEAARYDAWCEEKFFEEFSERARTAGLNETEIPEAYSALRSGDYTKMASYFDTSSPENGAVFWSRAKDEAAQYAKSINGTILEQTPGGQVFDNWKGLEGMYPEWESNSPLSQRQIWEALSAQYANGATGDVTYVHPMDYIGPMYERVESRIIFRRLREGFITNFIEVFTNGK